MRDFLVMFQKAKAVEDPANDESGKRHGARVRAIVADEPGSK